MAQDETAAAEIDEKAQDALAPGHSLMQGQFTIEKFLNSGGFGITYIARDSLNRKVVIKECFPEAFCLRAQASVRARSRSLTNEYSSIVKKFVDEAYSLAKVQHPNIVGVHQVFEENNTAYMVLDFIEGSDFLDVMEGRGAKPNPAEIEEILAKLLDAIGTIHDTDMLHRDISPDNILLRSHTEPVLIDFGAARQDVTKTGRIKSELRVIKDGYSPQEFYVSGAEQGPYSDLYALGATFYQVITGELPANAQARLAAVAEGRADPYQPVAGRISGYSDSFLTGIDNALKILPKDRIGSAGEWLDHLQGSMPVGMVAASKPVAPKTQSAKKSAGADKSKARILAGVGLAVPVVGSFFLLQAGNDLAAPEEAPADPFIAELALGEGIAQLTEPSPDAPVQSTDQDVGVALALNVAEAEPPAADLTAALGLPAAEPEQVDLTAALDLPAAEPEQVDLSAALDLPTAEPETTKTIAPSDLVEQASLAVAGPVGMAEVPVLRAESDAIDAVFEAATADDVLEAELPDGTVFETRLVDGTWTNIVTDVPPASELRVSDVLVGDLQNQLRFEEKTSLSDVLKQASAENRGKLTLAVRRDDVLFAVTIAMPSS